MTIMELFIKNIYFGSERKQYLIFCNDRKYNINIMDLEIIPISASIFGI